MVRVDAGAGSLECTDGKRFSKLCGGNRQPRSGQRIDRARGPRVESHRMKILVIDIGGTHVKVLATGHRKFVEIP